MTLQSLYEAILASLGLTVDQGLVSEVTPTGLTPVMVSSKRLVVPTRDIQRTANWNVQQAFHPACESVVRGESAVIRWMRMMVNTRLTFNIMAVVKELMSIAIDPKRHGSLSPTQAGYLSALADVDAKTYENLMKVLEQISPEGDKRVVNVYLKRGGQLKGVGYMRVAIVTFPILEQFKNEEHIIFGVKMRKKDRLAIEALFRYVLGDVNETESYSRGSANQAAPYFDALMRAFIAVQGRINNLVALYSKDFAAYPGVGANLDWAETLEDLDKLRIQIPPLTGNEGDVPGNEAQPVSAPQTPGVVSQSVPQAGPVTVTAQPGNDQTVALGYNGARIKPLGAPAAQAAANGVSVPGTIVDEGAEWAKFVASRSMPMMPQFQAAGGMNPGMMMQQPMMQQMPMMNPGMMMPQQQMPMMWNNGMMMPQQPMMPQFQAVGGAPVPQQPMIGMQQPMMPMTPMMPGNSGI